MKQRSRYATPRSRSSGKRRLVIVLALVIIAAIGGVVYVRGQQAQTATDAPKNAAPAAQNQSTDDTIRFIATGDMLPHDAVNQAARQADGSYNYVPLFGDVAPLMKQADISFCNQESPSAGGMAVTGYPAFNAPPAFAAGLSNVGCNVINLANNHSNDKGQAGIAETLDVWDGLPKLAAAGMARSAEDQAKIAYFSVKDVRFAFLSYTYCSNIAPSTSYGVNMLTKSLADAQLAEARQQADMIIVGAHWCRENTHTQTSLQQEWASYFAEQGVDVVVGTGPHWLQPVQKLPKADGGETIVWHSLGNFLNSQVELGGLLGGVAVMDIDTKTKTVTNVGFLPTYMHYEWTAAEKARSDYLARKNLKMYPLDAAADPLARSLLNTNVQRATDQVTEIMTRQTPVTMLTGKTY